MKIRIINEGEDLRGKRDRGEGEVAVASGHDGIDHRLGEAQKLHEDEGDGEAQGRAEFVA